MALINCTECGKEISDKAINCPNCGNPINQQSQVIVEEKDENKEFHRCPHCHSKDLNSDKKGFSGGKALAGAVLTGGIGLLAGTIGYKNIQFTCMRCGKKFKLGEALYITDKGKAELDKELTEVITTKGSQAAYQFYTKQTGSSIKASIDYVDSFIASNHIRSKKPGCAAVIFLLVLLTSSLLIAF